MRDAITRRAYVTLTLLKGQPDYERSLTQHRPRYVARDRSFTRDTKSSQKSERRVDFYIPKREETF